MNIDEQKRQFLNIYADFYIDYGLPGLSGWIEGIIFLDPSNRGKFWTQSSISKELTDLFSSNSRFPTSVSSINRTIKICVQYGTIEKRGSHKQGYTYHPLKGNDLLFNTFNSFINRNELIINRFQDLANNTGLEEPIASATQEQIIGLTFYNQMLDYALKWGKEQLKKWEKGDG